MHGDDYESDSEFAFLANVDRAIVAVLSDLHRTSDLRPLVRADIFENGLYITVDGNYETPYVEPHLDEVGTLQQVADYIQHRLTDRFHLWPVCPTDVIGLHAELRDGVAVWRCQFGEHNVAAIGRLGC